LPLLLTGVREYIIMPFTYSDKNLRSFKIQNRKYNNEKNIPTFKKKSGLKTHGSLLVKPPKVAGML